jgi:glucosamine-6-phosphate deaminase
MEARHLILLATGSAKAQAVQQLVEGPVSAAWPATIMQMHPHATVLLDESAAALLKHAGYYRNAWASKPAWQTI